MSVADVFNETTVNQRDRLKKLGQRFALQPCDGGKTGTTNEDTTAPHEALEETIALSIVDDTEIDIDGLDRYCLSGQEIPLVNALITLLREGRSDAHVTDVIDALEWGEYLPLKDEEKIIGSHLDALENNLPLSFFAFDRDSGMVFFPKLVTLIDTRFDTFCTDKSSPSQELGYADRIDDAGLENSIDVVSEGVARVCRLRTRNLAVLVDGREVTLTADVHAILSFLATTDEGERKRRNEVLASDYWDDRGRSAGAAAQAYVKALSSLREKLPDYVISGGERGGGYVSLAQKPFQLQVAEDYEPPKTPKELSMQEESHMVLGLEPFIDAGTVPDGLWEAMSQKPELFRRRIRSLYKKIEAIKGPSPVKTRYLLLCEHLDMREVMASLKVRDVYDDESPEEPLTEYVSSKVKGTETIRPTGATEQESQQVRFRPYMNRDWQEYANCLGVDPELFFPERGASTREAKEVCRGCSVREDCLEYSLANGEKHGIWGGLSERERRRLRKQRTIANRQKSS